MAFSKLHNPGSEAADMPGMVQRNGWADLPSLVRHAKVSRKKRNLSRKLRRLATASEKRAWKLLRNRRLLGLKFRRQQVIRGYIVDFYCAELRLALEIDGGIHDQPEQADYDCGRDLELLEMGVVVLRIDPNDVRAELLHRLLEPLVMRARKAARSGGNWAGG